MKRLVMVLAATTLLAGSAFAGLIDPALDAVLQQRRADENVSALVYLAVQTDLAGITAQMDVERASLRKRHERVVLTLQETANATQGEMLAYLAIRQALGGVKEFKAFWIVNAIRVVGLPAEIRALADRPGVDRVYYDHEVEIIEPVGGFDAIDAANAAEGAGGGGALLGAIEPGVVAVRAPEVWALGITGAGVLVANIDTGVDGNHPALASRWEGIANPMYLGNPQWAWYDPAFGDNSFPYDDGGHGTHTLGSVIGGAPGDQIGVAPGAHWISAAAIDRPGASISQTVASAISAFEWMVDPDGNPATNFDVPAVCSNSWGLITAHGYPECDETFWSFLDASEAAGTIQVFSAGNEGTSGLRRPSDRATDEYRTLAVAAVDGNDPGWPIASFSSRGPTQCTPDGSSAIKPDISAPGVNVRSSLPGGGYGSLSGTSMASPHINGVIALIREANPDLSSEQVKQILYDTAVDLGTAGEDNSYGYGMVDAFEAVQAALSTVGLTFDFPNGRPEFVDPNGGATIRVVVSGATIAPEPGTGKLYYTTGGPFTEVDMVEVTANTYDAVFPAFPCGASVNYYFSAQAESGDVALNPFSAPAVFYTATAYSGLVVAHLDDAETDPGWTVTNEALEDGAWDRGVPAGGDFVPGDRGDPATDGDGSGQCWLTDNAAGNSDVDGGPTRLTSPTLDATGLFDARVGYLRWFTNDDNDIDALTVEISNNDGASWVLLESVGNAGSWTNVSFRIADFVTPTNQMRMRFSATDNPNDSVTEAAIDGLRIFSFVCDEPACPEDIDGSGEVAFPDLLALLAAWGPCPGCPEDVDGDNEVAFQDLLLLLAAWGPCS